jgi:hypothetical protein
MKLVGILVKIFLLANSLWNLSVAKNLKKMSSKLKDTKLFRGVEYIYLLGVSFLLHIWDWQE